jgi:hypothetical protein
MNAFCQIRNFQIIPIHNSFGTVINQYVVTDFNNNIFFHGTYLACWCEMKRLEQVYWDEYYYSNEIITSDSTNTGNIIPGNEINNVAWDQKSEVKTINPESGFWVGKKFITFMESELEEI